MDRETRRLLHRFAGPLVAGLLLSLGLASVAEAKPARLARDTTKSVSSQKALAITPSTQWQTWWGTPVFTPGSVALSSAVPTKPSETHSALITSKQTWLNQTISFTTTTLAQLRTGSAPNPWEVGWVMFRFRDPSNYYYFIVKPNGFELGKKQGSDAQIFLATGNLPTQVIGAPQRVVVQTQGANIQISVNGAPVVNYTDRNPLLSPGSVGLYEEDSHVLFNSFSVS